MNLNKWAREITLREGKKVNLSIGQVKEVLKIILRDLKKMTMKDILAMLAKLK